MKVKKVKKRLFAFVLILFVAGGSVFALTTGNFVLSGTVTSSQGISIVADPNASAIDLMTTTADLQVAVVTEKSNIAGYSVQVWSLNGGTLDGTVLAESLDYTAKYTGYNSGVAFTLVPRPISFEYIYGNTLSA
ncbi:MAG: hypothetical protein HQ557_10105 [Bacteroidetes bacterium]|nr:hypothetical protein [Bacteroidota bacterium]